MNPFYAAAAGPSFSFPFSSQTQQQSKSIGSDSIVAYLYSYPSFADALPSAQVPKKLLSTNNPCRQSESSKVQRRCDQCVFGNKQIGYCSPLPQCGVCGLDTTVQRNNQQRYAVYRLFPESDRPCLSDICFCNRLCVSSQSRQQL